MDTHSAFHFGWMSTLCSGRGPLPATPLPSISDSTARFFREISPHLPKHYRCCDRRQRKQLLKKHGRGVVRSTGKREATVLSVRALGLQEIKRAVDWFIPLRRDSEVHLKD